VLPVQIVDPEVHRLIAEGPSRRRRFLDWGVFHVEHTFVGDWQKYQQTLKQRNAALRLRQSQAMVSAWDGELVRLGEKIDISRKGYVRALAPVAATLARSLLGAELSLSYLPGWARDSSFQIALGESWGRDQDSGVTSVGPQRAELGVRLDGVPVKDRISRGQQKLLAAALLIAQLRLFPKDGLVQPTLLLDDPAAELDGERLLGLIAEVSGEAIQLVVSSLTSHFDAFGAPGRRYRIDSGRVVSTEE
jgi:DNA replication and repair protein RecF